MNYYLLCPHLFLLTFNLIHYISDIFDWCIAGGRSAQWNMFVIMKNLEIKKVEKKDVQQQLSCISLMRGRGWEKILYDHGLGQKNVASNENVIIAWANNSKAISGAYFSAIVFPTLN